MAVCASCGTTILFGGARDGDTRYCNARCQQRGRLAAAATSAFTEQELQTELLNLHRGPCPLCHQAGPVDVHKRYRVWSALVITSYRTVPQVSCRRCGVKGQLGDSAFSLVCGWWGIPWGLAMTPVQIGRNLSGVFGGPDPTQPSPDLERAVRLMLGARAVRAKGPIVIP